MCGICGIIDPQQKIRPHQRDEFVSAMNQAIRHRGPDGSGRYADAICHLAMRRLAIIDLHTGDQPLYNERGNIGVFLMERSIITGNCVGPCWNKVINFRPIPIPKCSFTCTKKKAPPCCRCSRACLPSVYLIKPIIVFYWPEIVLAKSHFIIIWRMKYFLFPARSLPSWKISASPGS